jgi:hypothetical protein
MVLKPDVWLPKFQFIMQTISINYPNTPNDVTKKKYYDFIQNLPLFFPEKPMGDLFMKMLDQYPVTPYLSSRESFMKWIHYINNKINKKMEWNELSFRESLEKYYELYKPDSIKKRDLYRERKKYIQFGFLIGGIGITYYLYRK